MSTDSANDLSRQGVASDPSQKFLSKELALLDRYELQDALVDALGKTENHRHLVAAAAKCHRMFRAWVCSRNHRFARAEDSCSLRVCPHCARRRSVVLGGRMESFLVGKAKNTLRYVVLSERNCEDLHEGMALLWESWTRLRRSVRWARKVKGCIVALEVTRNEATGTWHPHLNVLMEGDYFPQAELTESWIEATEGRGEMAWIKAADAGSVRELIKYVTKLSDLIGHPEALDEFLTVVFHKRLMRTYGTFYGLKLEDEESPRLQTCPDCESTDLVKLCLVHPHQISMDFRGVLRVNRSPRDDLREVEAAVEFNPSTPARKKINYMPTLQKRWDKAGAGFAERHQDLTIAADRLGILNVDRVAGWGFSEWLAKLKPVVSSQSTDSPQPFDPPACHSLPPVVEKADYKNPPQLPLSEFGESWRARL
jgi:replication protein